MDDIVGTEAYIIPSAELFSSEVPWVDPCVSTIPSMFNSFIEILWVQQVALSFVASENTLLKTLLDLFVYKIKIIIFPPEFLIDGD